MRNRLDRLGWALAFVAGVVLLVAGAVWVGDFIEDDALISLRYADRFLAGKGLTWNDGERVEGYSNLSWVLGSAALGSVGVDLIVAARILAFGFWGVTFGALLMLARRVGASWAGFGTALIVLGATASLSVWAMGALEQPLVVACVAIAFWALAELTFAKDRTGFWGGIAAAALCLLVWTRPDAPLLVVVIASASFFVVRRRIDTRAAAGTFVLVAGAPFLAWLIQLGFRLAYYGEWVPNTAHIKAHLGAERIQGGLDYVRDGLRTAWLATAAGVLGTALAMARRERRVLGGAVLAVALVWTGYVVVIGGDHFPAYRHLLVTHLCFAVLLIIGLGGWRGPVSREAPTAALLLAAAVAVPYVRSQRRVDDVNVARRARWQWDGRAVGEMFGVAFAAERPLWAVTAAGCLPYFSKLPALDMLGLNDAHIARQPPDPSFPLAHDHGDGRYVLERAPDLITFGVPRGLRSAFKSGREMKRDPRFAREYQRTTFRTLTPISVLTDTYIRRRGKVGITGLPRDGVDGLPSGRLVVPAYLLRGVTGHPLPDGRLGARIDRRSRVGVIGLPALPAGRYRARLHPANPRVELRILSRAGATLLAGFDGAFAISVPSAVRLELRAPQLSTLVGSIIIDRVGAAPIDATKGKVVIATQSASPLPQARRRRLDDWDSTAAEGVRATTPFTASEDDWLCFGISGGRAESYHDQVGVRIVDVSGDVPAARMVFTGKNDERSREVCTDLGPFEGQTLRIEVFDRSATHDIEARDFLLYRP